MHIGNDTRLVTICCPIWWNQICRLNLVISISLQNLADLLHQIVIIPIWWPNLSAYFIVFNLEHFHIVQNLLSHTICCHNLVGRLLLSQSGEPICRTESVEIYDKWVDTIWWTNLSDIIWLVTNSLEIFVKWVELNIFNYNLLRNVHQIDFTSHSG